MRFVDVLEQRIVDAQTSAALRRRVARLDTYAEGLQGLTLFSFGAGAYGPKWWLGVGCIAVLARIFVIRAAEGPRWELAERARR